MAVSTIKVGSASECVFHDLSVMVYQCKQSCLVSASWGVPWVVLS